MNSFHLYNPTEVVFGKDTELAAGKQVKKWGGKKALIVYGGNSAVKSGLLGRVEQSLKDSGVSYVALGGVQPNPRLSLVYEGIKTSRTEGVDFLLAVGGGSAIDTAKGIAVGVANPETDVWEYYLGEKVTNCLPVGVILTIAAAGSETSNSSVITKDEGHVKRSIDQDPIRPRFAILNPGLTYTLPKYQIACGVVDIMMHTMERYLSTGLGNEMTDRIAEQVLKNMIKYGPVQFETPTDYKAASEIMWTGSLAHNGLTGAGSCGGDWSTHLIGHELSGKYDAAHGATLAAVWGSWARYVCKENILRFVQYAVNVWDCDLDSENPENTALAGIVKTEKFFSALSMPTSIPELIKENVTQQDMAAMADLCFQGRTSIGAFKELWRDDVYNIYAAANRQ